MNFNCPTLQIDVTDTYEDDWASKAASFVEEKLVASCELLTQIARTWFLKFGGFFQTHLPRTRESSPRSLEM